MSNSIIAAVDTINTEIAEQKGIIAAANKRIEELAKARTALGALIGADDVAEARDVAHVPAPDRVTAPRRSRATVPANTVKDAPMTPSEAGEAFVKNAVKQSRRAKGDTKDEATATLREQRIENLRKAREAKAAKAKGNQPKSSRATSKRASTNGNHKGTRRDQIVALLKQDMSPRDIGEKLGIAPNYVYHVKRAM